MPEIEPVPDLPEPDAALNVVLALVSAYVEDLPKKKRDAFLRRVSTNLGMQRAAYNVTRFRPASADPQAHRAMTEAQTWWRSALGTVLRLRE